jgi:TonB family protein
MEHSIRAAYRRPFLRPFDPLFRRCLVGSSALGLALLVAIAVAPERRVEVTSVDDVPDRFAKLIVEPAKEPRGAPAAPAVRQPEPETPAPPAAPKPPEPAPVRKEPRPARRTPLADAAPAVPDAGAAGRELAQRQISKTLGASAPSLDRALAGLSTALATPSAAEPKTSEGRRRTTRPRARVADPAALAPQAEGSGVGADLDGSSIGSSLIAIEALGDVGAEDEGGASSGGGAPGGGASSGGHAGGARLGVYRDDVSLLAVVRKYAAGIQFCYENELKRNPVLRGKLVVAITVAASGEVLDATVVQDQIRSEALVECALAQIRTWRFPSIPEGTTSFRAPFVFTPPQ